SVHLYVCLSVGPCFFLSATLSVCLAVCMSICLSFGPCFCLFACVCLSAYPGAIANAQRIGQSDRSHDYMLNYDIILMIILCVHSLIRNTIFYNHFNCV